MQEPSHSLASLRWSCEVYMIAARADAALLYVPEDVLSDHRVQIRCAWAELQLQRPQGPQLGRAGGSHAQLLLGAASTVPWGFRLCQPPGPVQGAAHSRADAVEHVICGAQVAVPIVEQAARSHEAYH